MTNPDNAKFHARAEAVSWNTDIVMNPLKFISATNEAAAAAFERHRRDRDDPMTKKQKELKRKHGTPAEWGGAVWGACADFWCTPNEAQEAIRKYEAEWVEAGKCRMKTKRKKLKWVETELRSGDYLVICSDPPLGEDLKWLALKAFMMIGIYSTQRAAIAACEWHAAERGKK